ncbi:MAG: hypothetical protein ABW189_02690 [Rickettsiales bacterium]
MKTSFAFGDKTVSVAGAWRAISAFVSFIAHERHVTRAFPFFAMIGVGVAFAKATELGFVGFLHGAVGVMLATFAIYKCLHPKKFIASFSVYDPVAKFFPSYAVVFAALQLALGFAFLTFWQQGATYVLTFMLSSASAIGLLLEDASDVDSYGAETLLHTDAKTAGLVELLFPAAASLLLIILASY